MQPKTLRTKTFWTGLAMLVSGLGMIATGHPAEGIQTMAGGLVTIFVRDAIAKVEPMNR